MAATRRDAVGRANRGLFPEASISIMRAKPEGWTEFARVEASGAEQIIEESEEFAHVSQAHICGVGGTFKGALALYNELFQQDRHNKLMEADKLKDIIQRFTRDHGIEQQDTVILLKTVPERLNTIIPGLVIADVLATRFASHTIAYSDSGVREGYIYDQIVSKEKNK